jgi:hypothetical protein
MLALLEWAADRLKKWHNIGNEPPTMKAAELLQKRGVIWQETNQCKLTPQK